MAAPTIAVKASKRFEENQFDPKGTGVQLPVSATMVVAHVQDHLQRAGWSSDAARETVMVPNVFSNVRAAFVPEPSGPKLRNKIVSGFSAHAHLALVRWVWAHTLDVPQAQWLAVDLLRDESAEGQWLISAVTPQTQAYVLPRAGSEDKLVLAGFESLFVPVRVATYTAPGKPVVRLWTKADATQFDRMCKEDKSVEWTRVCTEDESAIESARDAFREFMAEVEGEGAADKK